MKFLLSLLMSVFLVHGMGNCAVAFANEPAQIEQTTSYVVAQADAAAPEVEAQAAQVTQEEVESPVAEPKDWGDVAEFFPAMIQAVKSGNWLLFGALVSLILTFAVKQFVLPKLGVGNGILPILSVVLGAVAGVGGAVASGASLGAAALAVLSGPLASTLWDAIVKYFFPKKA